MWRWWGLFERHCLPSTHACSCPSAYCTTIIHAYSCPYACALRANVHCFKHPL